MTSPATVTALGVTPAAARALMSGARSSRPAAFSRAERIESPRGVGSTDTERASAFDALGGGQAKLAGDQTALRRGERLERAGTQGAQLLAAVGPGLAQARRPQDAQMPADERLRQAEPGPSSLTGNGPDSPRIAHTRSRVGSAVAR